MKSTTTLLGVLALFNVNAQIATTTLQFNNAGARINDAGVFFSNIANQLAGY